LLAQCDAFVKDHLHLFGNAELVLISSLEFFSEFIQLMARQVWSTIVAEVLSAKCYSLIVDSTSDITRLDQLGFAVRCVNKTGVPG